ncbi:hypothetical protein PINS_up019078 [Pythium insidiosum]|nr:hypothetical protein PINS_up019078 [Pythium insidiosum]
MLPLPALDQRVRERLRRFAITILLLLYARRTWRTFHAHHFHLQLQAERVSRGRHVLNILKYTFVAQLLAACEYLIPIAKPVLAWRIARLLVWRSESVVSNALYGSHPRNTIDVYGVEPQAEPRKPLLLFVHGGAWSFGHKWQYGLVGKYLAKHGFLVAVINYRTYPLGSVTEQTKDVEERGEDCVYLRRVLRLLRGRALDSLVRVTHRSIGWQSTHPDTEVTESASSSSVTPQVRRIDGEESDTCSSSVRSLNSWRQAPISVR